MSVTTTQVQMLEKFAVLRRQHSLCDVLLQAENASGEASKAAGVEAGEEAGEPAIEAHGTWAHRVVLAAASPYFFTMFTRVEESTQPVVTIKNMEAVALYSIVEYIYNPASLSVSVDNAQALLSAASLLCMDEVRDAVCVFLERALEVDNALGIRAIAELHACAALAAAAAGFIDTHFERVLQADELLALEPSALAALLDCLAVPTEERVLDAVLRWTQHRPQERQQHLYELLRHVRLPLLPPEELVKRVREEPLASAELRVQHQLVEALCYLHVPSSRCALSAADNDWYRPRPHRAAVSGPNALLVVGGRNENTGFASEVTCYELLSGRWQSFVALPEPRAGAGAAVLDGQVYVVGGYDGSQSRSTTWVFDAARGSWSSGPWLTTARRNLAVAVLNGVLYAVGGRISTLTPVNTAESLDPREGVWRAAGRMYTARGSHGVAALDGLLYAVGGHNGNLRWLNTVEKYEPSSRSWELVEPMSERRMGPAVSVVEDVLYAAGGYNTSGTLQSVERYRAGSCWEPAPAMITARHGAAATTHDGLLYVAGGQDDLDFNFDSVEVFSPATGAWSELPAAMPASRTDLAAVVIHWPPPAP